MYKLIIIFVLFCWVSNVNAQHHSEDELTIRGKIVSSKKNGDEPIPGAKIKWKTDEHMAISGIDGSFEIHVHSLPDTLLIKFTGYELLAFEIKDPSIFYTFNLKEGKMLDGVDVIAFDSGKTIDLLDPFNIEKLGQDELRKAACCNLSESFETNASVDVNMTDAISGAKKIQMLGLDGIYTQIQYENLPMVRGLSSSYGLNYTPGTWIESIQITK